LYKNSHNDIDQDSNQFYVLSYLWKEKYSSEFRPPMEHDQKLPAAIILQAQWSFITEGLNKTEELIHF